MPDRPSRRPPIRLPPSPGGLPFELVGALEPRRDTAGRVLEYTHDVPPGVRCNPHAAGPFCWFKLPDARRVAGVYAVMVAGCVTYVGECVDLAARFGPNGYGSIAARNCHHGGQATNCKVNALVLKALKAGYEVEVWFHATSRRKEVEQGLMRPQTPPWNGRIGRRADRAVNPLTGGEQRTLSSPRRTSRPSTRTVEPNMPIPTSDDFRIALANEFERAGRAGLKKITINAGNLHRLVGGYPGPNHRMPVCCAVMYSEAKPADRIADAPPAGKGPRLTIGYVLPRPS